MSAAGGPLPRNELEPAGAVSDVRLAVCNFFGFRSRRRTKDDHPGPEAITGVVKERTRADEQAPGVELVDELVMALRELFLAQRTVRRRVDDLVIDNPALLALAHVAYSSGPC